MPVPPSSSDSFLLPDDPDKWMRFLRQHGVRSAEFVHAFSLLGTLAMLDERDASEIAGQEFEGKVSNDLPLQPWHTACLEEDFAGWNQWWTLYLKVRDRWTTHTRGIRLAMNLRAYWMEHEEQAMLLAVRVIRSFKLTLKQTLASCFREHFRLLLWGIGEDPSDGLSIASWPMQGFLRDLVALQPHHRVLLTGAENTLLLQELMDRISGVARYTPTNKLTAVAMHGVTVRTGSVSFAEQALAMLLAYEVEQPNVSLDASNALSLEPVYDWVIATPPWGAVTQQEDIGLPLPTRRIESIVLQRALMGLAPNGRLILWMSRSFARRTSEEPLRRWLLDHHSLHAVVELPAEATSGTRLASLLMLISQGQPCDSHLFIGEPLMKRCLEDWELAPTHPQMTLLALLLRAAMGGITEQDRIFLSEDSRMVNPTFAEERREMLALSRELADLTSNVQQGSRLAELRTGMVFRNSWDSHDAEFTWPRDLEAGLNYTLGQLVAAQSRLRLTKLEDVADIFKGVSYSRDRTVPSTALRVAERRSHVGIIRVSDLSRTMDPDVLLPFCQEPALLLTEIAAAELQDRHFLQPWDILLSAAGTVDKVSVFESEEERCVAAQQIIIIRPKVGHESKTIRHIVGLLVSEAGKDWLRSLATGSVIKHLVLRDLREMPMIDGPDAVLDAIGEHLLRGHPLETAVSVFDDRLRQDPTLAFFSECEAMRTTFAPESANEVEAWLGKLAAALEIWKQGFNEVIPQGRLRDWWIDVDAFIRRLLRALRTNPGYDRLTLLLFWQQAFAEREMGLASAIEQFPKTLEASTVPNADELQRGGVTHRGKTLLRRMSELAAREVGQQFQAVKLRVTIAPPEVTVATPTVVTVDLVNLSPLSLQDVVLSVNEGRNQAKLLTCSQGLKLPLVVHAAYAGPLPIVVQWKARTLDGRAFNGTIKEQVVAVSLRTASLAPQLNPYVDGGSPVGGKDMMFYGRKEALRRMDQAFSRGHRTTVLIVEGNRRIGKSSLLLYYRTHRLDLDKWLPVEINFQRFGTSSGGNRQKAPGIPDRRIFQGMAKRLLETTSEAGLAVPVAGFGLVSAGLQSETRKMLLTELEVFFNDGDPFERFLHVLEATMAMLAEKRLLLMFDEFDLIQAGIDSGVTGSQVPENFRHLLQAYPQLAAVLTGSLKIRRLRQQYWNVLFNLGQSLQLRGLEPEEAAELVTEPVRGNLAYSPEAVNEIVRLTGRQPLLIQTLCGRLFEMSQDQKTVLVTLDMVTEAAQEQVEDSETFARLWDDIASPRQRALILVLEQMTRGDAPVQLVLLREQAEEKGLRFESLQPFKADLDALRDQDVLSSITNDQVETLSFEVPLFALWLRRHQDFAAVCAEVAESEDQPQSFL